MQTFRWEDVDVAANKRAFLDLLLEAAGRVSPCARRRGKRRLSCLARHCDIDRMTLLRALEREGLPDLGTLDRLEEHTEIPLLRWLIALGRLDPLDLALALEQEAPALVLTASERAWLDRIRSWPQEEARHHFEYVRRVRGLDLDQT